MPSLITLSFAKLAPIGVMPALRANLQQRLKPAQGFGKRLQSGLKA